MIKQEKNIQRKSACYQRFSASILPKIVFIALAVLLLIFIPFEDSFAACEDILIYVFPRVSADSTDFDGEIVTHLAGEGYTVTSMTRGGVDELTPALLSSYGQIWIIDAGDDQPNITPAEVANLVNYYNAGGNILLTGENGTGFAWPELYNDVDTIAQAFSTNMSFGLDGTEPDCSNVAFTVSSDSVFILNGVSAIRTSGDNSNVFTTTTNPNVESVAASTTGIDIVYILNEPAPKGKILFHPSYFTFIDATLMFPLSGINSCDSTQYTKNVANWFCFHCSWINDNCGDAPCPAMEMHQTCGPVGCAGNCGGGFSEGDTKCVIDPINCGAVCPDGSCDFPETSIVDFGFEILCPEDCGCDNDTFCEAERGENIWNCALDCPLAAGIDCLCQENAKDLGGEGLVPCGRNFDDRDTISICECCPCTFCHTFLLMKRITDFAVKQVLPALLVLIVVVAGVLYLLGGFSGSLISKANNIFKIIGIGTAIVFAGWVVINLTLYVITGKQTDSGAAQVFAGRWDEITCDYGKTCTTADCGDGIVQRPNFNGLDEECEIEERWEGFKARANAGGAIDTDGIVGPNVIFGNIDENDYWNSVCACDKCIISGSADACCNNWRLDYGEECDSTVSEANWLVSPYVFQDADGDGWQDGDLDQDGDIDNDDYYLSICRCEDDCIYGVEETLDTFHDSSNVFTLNIPAGGSDSSAHIRLPEDTKVCATSLEIKFSGPAGEKTPYIWIPASTQNKLIQLKTSDGSLVRVFQNGSDSCAANAFNNPSRITVIPGGDIWIVNRGAGSVTRLGKKIIGGIPCVGDDCYECKGTYVTCGADNRGVTFDLEGNIWAGSYIGSCLVRLCGYIGCTDVNGNGGYSIGDKMEIDSAGNFQINGFSVYGLIGDSYGNVWSVNGSTNRVEIDDVNAIIYSTATGDTYGIGIDNEGDIWIGKHAIEDIWEIDGADPGGAGTGVIETQCPTAFTNTGLAVDGDNNVWSTGYSGNVIYVIKGGDCSQTFSRTGVCTWNQPHGTAIDAGNHAWLVCDTGEAVKYKFHDDGDVIKDDDGNDDIEEVQRINLCALPGVGCGNESGATYNYSDMTGFRTPGLSLCIGAACFPISTTVALTGFEKELQAALAGCAGGIAVACDARFSPPHTNCCDVPIEVRAVLGGGQYDLYNLDIKYNPPQ